MTLYFGGIGIVDIPYGLKWIQHSDELLAIGGVFYRNGNETATVLVH